MPELVGLATSEQTSGEGVWTSKKCPMVREGEVFFFLVTLAPPPPSPRHCQGPIFEGMPRPEPNVFSKKAQRAQERWRDPVYREEQLSKRKKPYAPRKPVRSAIVEYRFLLFLVIGLSFLWFAGISNLCDFDVPFSHSETFLSLGCLVASLVSVSATG